MMRLPVVASLSGQINSNQQSGNYKFYVGYTLDVYKMGT
jgi:hypothetical protein